MVIDTSALLAVFFNEKSAQAVAKIMESNANALRMSTVNLSEVMILCEDRQPQLFEAISQDLLSSGIRFVAPTVRHAQIAASARMKYPLNLGDCFAYALAKEENVALLTLDSDFKKTDLELVRIGG